MLTFLACLAGIIIILLILSYPRMGVYLLIFFSVFQLTYFHRWDIVNISRFWAWMPFLFTGILLLPLIAKLISEQKFIPPRDGGSRPGCKPGDESAFGMSPRRGATTAAAATGVNPWGSIFYNKSPIQKLYLFTIGIVIIAFVSCLLNSVSPLIGIFGLRYILLVMVVVSLLYSFKNLILDIESFMRFVVWIGVIQIPFVILQRVLFNKLGIILRSETYDLVTGTFASDSVLGFIQLFSLSIVLIYWFRTGRAIIGKFIFPLIIILSIPIAVSNSRAIFLFFVILLFVIIIRYRKNLAQNLFRYVIYGITLIGIVYLGTIITFAKFQRHDYGDDLKQGYSFENILRYNLTRALPPVRYLENEELDPRMGRAAAIMAAIDLIKDKSFTLFFGVGSGNTQQSQVFGRDGQYYQEYGPLSGLNRNQLSLIISELGLSGLLLYFLFFWQLWIAIRRVKEIEILKHKIIVDTYAVLLILISLFSFYSWILNDYAIILVVSYFIATLQQAYLQANSQDVR